MNELELRVRVQNTVEDTINALVNQGVSFTLVEDALYKSLSYVKDKAYQELLISVSSSPVEKESQEKEEE